MDLAEAIPIDVTGEANLHVREREKFRTSQHLIFLHQYINLSIFDHRKYDGNIYFSCMEPLGRES